MNYNYVLLIWTKTQYLGSNPITVSKLDLRAKWFHVFDKVHLAGWLNDMLGPAVDSSQQAAHVKCILRLRHVFPELVGTHRETHTCARRLSHGRRHALTPNCHVFLVLPSRGTGLLPSAVARPLEDLVFSAGGQPSGSTLPQRMASASFFPSS